MNEKKIKEKVMIRCFASLPYAMEKTQNYTYEIRNCSDVALAAGTFICFDVYFVVSLLFIF